MPLVLALGLGLAVLLLALGSLTAWQVAQGGELELRQREAQMLGDSARTVANDLSVALDERRADLLSLRDLLEIDFTHADAAQRRALLGRTLASHPRYLWLGLTDLQGEVVLAAQGQLEGQSMRGQAWFEAALTGREFFASLPAPLTTPGRTDASAQPPGPAEGAEAPLARTIDISLPLHAAHARTDAPHGDGQAAAGHSAAVGEVVGVLGSRLDERLVADAIHRALGTRGSQHRLSAAVVDDDGRLIYDTRGAQGRVAQLPAAVDTAADGSAAAASASAAVEMFESAWPGQSGTQESYIVAARVPATGTLRGALPWRVVVRSDAEQLHASVVQLHRRVITVCVIVGLVFALAGALLLRGATVSLQDLVDDMRRFAITGDLPTERPASRIAEVARLHGGLLAMTRHVVEQRAALSESQQQVVEALARAGEYRDTDTGQHVLRMSHCAGHMAELLGLERLQIEQIRLAAQLHDIGKIGIPDAVLLKHGRFNDEERAIVRRHPEIGAGILAGFDAPVLTLARTVAYTHHERWDGQGYPRGLAGEAIPLAGRIVALVDVFDALLSSRPYKTGWPLERVLDWLRQQSGSHFDPQLTGLLLSHVDDFVRIRADIDALEPAANDTDAGALLPLTADAGLAAAGLPSLTPVARVA
ncbi:MAG: hypothetical protein RIQ60_1454 [Pseudomonadota bacterium]|jgi:hypothetical protein